MGVALLPFVDEVRLLAALDARRHLLTAEERERNLRRPELLFCRADTDLGRLLEGTYDVEDPLPEDGTPAGELLFFHFLEVLEAAAIPKLSILESGCLLR